MLKNPLYLSVNQIQSIADIGIDAWYLKPLHLNESADDKAHSVLLDDLVESFNALDSEGSELSTKPSADKPTKTEDTQALQKNRPIEKLATKHRKVLQGPKSLKIETSGCFLAPEDENLSFSFPLLPSTSWEALENETEKLAKENGQHCIHGSGKHDADDLLLFTPPESIRNNEVTPEALTHLELSEKAQRLLSEMLVSVGLKSVTTYRTSILKFPTEYGQDPDKYNLNKHLSLLSSELALVLPKRIWVFGALPSNILTQTDAPLSTLLEKKYKLIFEGLNSQMNSSRIIFLPTLDYLLALPIEKGKVWQQIKSFL